MGVDLSDMVCGENLSKVSMCMRTSLAQNINASSLLAGSWKAICKTNATVYQHQLFTRLEKIRTNGSVEQFPVGSNDH